MNILEIVPSLRKRALLDLASSLVQLYIQEAFPLLPFDKYSI